MARIVRRPQTGQPNSGPGSVSLGTPPVQPEYGTGVFFWKGKEMHAILVWLVLCCAGGPTLAAECCCDKHKAKAKSQKVIPPAVKGAHDKLFGREEELVKLRELNARLKVMDEKLSALETRLKALEDWAKKLTEWLEKLP